MLTLLLSIIFSKFLKKNELIQVAIKMLKINNEEEDQAIVTNKFMQEASKKFFICFNSTSRPNYKYNFKPFLQIIILIFVNLFF